MSYTISAGIEEAELKVWLEEALQKYGAYQGKAVNYTHADIAPIVMCTIMFGGKILLGKRAYGLADAEGYWSTVNGFIDEVKPVKEIVQQECREELSFDVRTEQITVGKSYTLENPSEKRTYIVFPCLVQLEHEPTVTLDREHTEFTWVTRQELEKYHILDDLPYAIDAALSLE